MASAVACGESYNEHWGTDDLLEGKADGIADGAADLEFGTVHEGFVDKQSMVLYSVRLRRGDLLSAKKDVVSGDMAPHFSLIHNFTESLGSIDFEVTDTSLLKTYEIKVTGNYFFMVRAFGARGKGDYELKVDCTGGPCNGEFPTEFLEADDADKCLEQARACSFEDMVVFDGAVGPARAAALLDDCLGRFGTPDGNSCLEACDKQPDHGDKTADLICNDIVTDLQFYADQSEECSTVVDDCLVDCLDESSRSSTGELADQPFANCWSFGKNSTCSAYGRQVDTCGGELSRGSEEECFALCDATLGAFSDDVEQACKQICE